MDEQPKSQGVGLHLLVVFSILTLCIASSGYLLYDNQKEHIKREKQEDLAAIAELKVHEIATWRQERMGDAYFILESVIDADHLRRVFSADAGPGLIQEVKAWLTSFRDTRGYKSLSLVDAEGSVILATEGGEHICHDVKNTIPEAALKKAPVYFDLHRSDSLSEIHFFITVPLLNPDAPDGPALGAVLLRMDPHAFLYPLIQSWPVPSRSAETLLVRREGDEVLFLNELRHRKNTALTLRLPLDAPRLPAAVSLTRGEGVIEGLDYRGSSVLAAMRDVPESSWHLVSKVDVEEVYAPVRRAAWVVTIVTALLILAAGVGVALIWRHQRSLFYRQKYETEREKRELAQRYEHLTRYANDIILMMDRDCAIIEANERAVESYGYTRDELRDLNWHDLQDMSPTAEPGPDTQIGKDRLLQGAVFETRHQRKDGTVFPVEVSSRVVKLGAEEVHWNIIRDITERKEAERGILRLNRLYAFLSQVNQTVVRTRDRDELFKEACRVATEFGKFPLAWIGMVEGSAEQIVPLACSGGDGTSFGRAPLPLDVMRRGHGPGGEDLVCGGQWWSIWDDLGNDPLAETQPWRDEALKLGCRSCASVPIPFHGSVAAIFSVYATECHFFDQEEIRLLDEISRDMAFALEIMENEARRKRVEEQLRESENTYRTIFENTGTATLIAEEDTSIVLANKESEALSLYSREQLEGGMSWTEFVPAEHLEQMKDHHYARRKGPGLAPRNYDSRMLNRHGEIKDVHLTVAMIPGTSKSVISILDITRRRKVEEALRESEASYRALAENLPGIVYRAFVREDWRLRYFNDMIETFTGFGPHEVTSGEAFLIDPLVIPEDRERLSGAVSKAIEKNQAFEVEYRVKHKDGTVRHFAGRGRPSFAPDGGPLYVDGVIFDVTERKRFETRMLQVQKNEAIGTLAGGVAHDFNNILGAIIGYTDIMLFDLAESDPLRFSLEQVFKAAHRAKEIVQQILLFSRQQLNGHDIVPFHMHSVIDEALTLLRASLPSTIEIRRDISRNLGMAMADPAQMHQVLINLCTNAAHAMKDHGGILSVGLSRISIDAESEPFYVDLGVGAYLKLTVSDTGHGMDRGTLERIFDPYFTTKPVGEGSGLGLAVVQGIVKRFGGAIKAYSEPDKGSTFQVLIPEARSRSLDSVECHAPIPEGKERILLVDDETALVDMATKMLQRLGYDVVARADSQEALECFRAEPERFDLVITDYTMPRMTGVDLTKGILDIRADIPIIMLTGLNDQAAEEKAREAGVREFVRKPLSMRQMAEVVRKVVDGQ